jgi:hypothetical protein
MNLRRFIGYTKGILVSRTGRAEEQRTVFAGEDIVALARDPKDASRMLAGSYGDGLSNRRMAERIGTASSWNVRTIREALGADLWKRNELMAKSECGDEGRAKKALAPIGQLATMLRFEDDFVGVT